MRTMPIIIPMTVKPSGNSEKLTYGQSIVALGIMFSIFYFLVYMIILLVKNADKYSDLSLFGRIVFFPIHAVGVLINKIL